MLNHPSVKDVQINKWGYNIQGIQVGELIARGKRLCHMEKKVVDEAPEPVANPHSGAGHGLRRTGVYHGIKNDLVP
jgi:hypothetical protein